MLKVTHTCRRRGVLGTSQVYDAHALNPYIMGPFKGVYKTPEPCPESEVLYEEIYVNYEGAETRKYALLADHPRDLFGNDLLASHWIEDREQERRLALIELQVDAYSQTCFTDGN